jgi:plastocyanin
MIANAHGGWRRIVCAGAVPGLLACGLGTAFAAKARPATHTVVMNGTRFEPAQITIALGDSVVWKNNDPFPHNVASETGRFASKDVEPDRSWKYRAARRGDFPYVCTLHPGMTGILQVR